LIFFSGDDDGDPNDRGAKPEGWFGVPDAVVGDREGVFQASYGTERRHKALRRYIQYLGNTFFTKFRTLRQAAENLAIAVGSPANQPGTALSDFARLAEGLVQDILAALASFLDDIAEALEPTPGKRTEGAKRLALMAIFRQYWYPEGYRANSWGTKISCPIRRKP
jgi:hypothetical protein